MEWFVVTAFTGGAFAGGAIGSCCAGVVVIFVLMLVGTVGQQLLERHGKS